MCTPRFDTIAGVLINIALELYFFVTCTKMGKLLQSAMTQKYFSIVAASFNVQNTVIESLQFEDCL